MSFMLAMPKISLHGDGAINDLIAILSEKKLGKALIVTDEMLLKQGVISGLLALMETNHLPFVVFSQIMPNPTNVQVQSGFDYFLQQQCDYLIAFGGGSAIDAAKGIRVLAANPPPITAYAGVGQVKKQGPFLVAINTTAGTAAEVTSNAVITDVEQRVKKVIIDANLIPDIAVDDPDVMLGIPASVTAATGMDALTHAIEAYVTKGAHPLTDPCALAAIKLISATLPIAVADGKNRCAREKMALGQYLAGMAFNSAGLGAVHALAHQPGATHNLPHGVCNAILLPIVEAFNRPYAQSRFADIAQAMGVNTTQMSETQASEAAIKAICDLSTCVGIPEGFKELGVKEEDIALWVDKAMDDPCMPGNPVPLSREQVYALYFAAM